MPYVAPSRRNSRTAAQPHNRRPAFNVTFPRFGAEQFDAYQRSDSGKEFLRYTLGRDLARHEHIAGGADRVKDAFIFTFLTDVWSYADARAEVDELADGSVELYLKERDGRVVGIPEHDRLFYQIVASQLASQAERGCVSVSRSVLRFIFNRKPVRFYLLKHGPRVLYLAGDMITDVSDEVARKKKGKVSVNFNGLAFEMAHNTPEEMKARGRQMFKFEPTEAWWYDDGAPDVYCTYVTDVVDDEGSITELHTSTLFIKTPPELASYSPAELVEHAKNLYRENMLFGGTEKATLRVGFVEKTEMQNKPLKRPVGAAALGAYDFPAGDFRFTAEDEGKLARLRTILTQLHAGVMMAEGDGMYLATLEAGASDFVLTAAGDDADESAKARAAVLKQTLDEQELASGKTQATAAPGQEEATDVGQICSEDSGSDAVKQWLREQGTDPSVLSPDLLAFLAAVRQPSGKRQKKAPSGKRQAKTYYG
eukprot:Rhum_TRINITY_DN14993_c3_g1::Rhum_TRINITY_DN14993_c3_g1_i3::g.131113::m.131113